MKRNLIIFGTVSLVIAIIIFLLDFTRFEFWVGITNVKVYPAAFFGLLGLLLICRGVWRKPTD